MKIIFVFLLLFIFSNVSLFAQPFGGGTGEQTNPYQIWDENHFIELYDSVINATFTPWHNGKYFKLIQNIDIGSAIGLGRWRGYFYGNGKIINKNGEFGICGILDNEGVIDSLIVDGYIFTDEIYTAGIVGIIYNTYSMPSRPPGSITNCINNATITCTNDGSIYGVYGVGGIAYRNDGIISHCINNGSVSGVDRVGGIVGQNLGATITGCINTGKITATNSGSDLWGICGMGGIAAVSGGSISSCINLGAIEGQRNVAGIVGDGAGSTITNNINSGYIKGINGVGGVLGNNSYLYGNIPGATISNCINTGVVEGDEDVGAIVGKE